MSPDIARCSLGAKLHPPPLWIKNPCLIHCLVDAGIQRHSPQPQFGTSLRAIPALELHLGLAEAFIIIASSFNFSLLPVLLPPALHGCHGAKSVTCVFTPKLVPMSIKLCSFLLNMGGSADTATQWALTFPPPGRPYVCFYNWRGRKKMHRMYQMHRLALTRFLSLCCS